MESDSEHPGRRSACFCALCGGPLRSARIEGRERACCPACGFVAYSNPASASLGVVLDERGRVLLIRRAIQPHKGAWALPAGYQEADEEPQETVVREIREETGVEVEVLGLLEVLFVPEDPRKPANVHVYLCSALRGEPRGSDDALDARFFALDALPENLGFHNYERILSKLSAPERYPLSAWEELRRRLRL